MSAPSAELPKGKSGQVLSVEGGWVDPKTAKTKVVMVRVHFVRPGFMLGGSTWMTTDGILDRDTGIVECQIGGREFEVSRNSSVVQGLEILRK